MPESKEQQKATVVIPAFNEAATIDRVIRSIQQACDPVLDEIIVVDDGSGDDTAKIAKEAGARVIQHKINRGYGASLKTGIYASETDLVITLDADGQHRAEDVLRLFDFLDTSDMVVGQRTQLLHSPLWRMPGKWVLGWLARFLTQADIPDLNSGMRLMRKSVIEKYLHLCPSGFSFSTTITMTMHSRGYQVVYVPIEVEKRKSGSTVSLSTGLNTIILILRLATLFNPLRIFIPVSFSIGAVGFLWGIPYALSGYGVSVGSMLAISIAIVLFALGLISDQISALRLEKYE